MISKPKWLEQIESQSWEAELIVSGLTIYGSLALGPFLDRCLEWLIASLSFVFLQSLEAAILYIYLAYYGLVFAFIGHFIVRIFWVGIVGLSSAYPQGINVHNRAYSTDFLRKLRRKYTDLPELAVRIDRFSSTIFSLLWLIILFSLVIGFWFLLLNILSVLFNKITDSELPSIVIRAFAFLIIFLAFLSTALTQVKGIRDTAFARKYAFLINSVIAKIFFGPFESIINTVSFTFATNTRQLRIIAFSFLFPVLGMLFIIPRLYHYLNFMDANDYVEITHKYAFSNKYLYEDEIGDSRILLPLIQSQELEEDLMLFIPLLRMEAEMIYRDKPKLEDDLSSYERRQIKNKWQMERLNDFYTLELDGRELKNLDFLFRRHAHAGEHGALTYINIDSLSQGWHDLSIRYELELDTTHQVMRHIPFYKK